MRFNMTNAIKPCITCGNARRAGRFVGACPDCHDTGLMLDVDILKMAHDKLAKAAADHHLAGLITPTPQRPKIVCLCGSGRFLAAFEQAEFNETLAGKIVLTIGVNTHDVARSDDLVKHKPMLDQLHLRKIDLADEILVLNVGGYIGESTAREVHYAYAHGKPVRLMEPCLDEESQRRLNRLNP